VQYTGNVGGGNNDGIGGLGGIFIGSEQFFLLPIRVPAFLNIFGGIALVQQITTHRVNTPYANGPVREPGRIKRKRGLIE
jgi:hypothetical protein